MLDHPVARDIALFLFRAALGAVYIAHGWVKIARDGMDNTIAFVDSLHIPQPSLAAWGATIIELLGGLLLILGLLTTAVAGLLLLHSLAITYYAHISSGFFVENGGVEFMLVLIASLLLVVVFGAGRVSVDKYLSRFA